MKINDPYVYLLPNNQTFELIQNSQGLVLVNLKLIVFNSTVNGNISFYRQSKPKDEFIYPITTPVVVEWKYADITKINITDTNTYDYYANYYQSDYDCYPFCSIVYCHVISSLYSRL